MGSQNLDNQTRNIDRRGFLNRVTMAGAAAIAPTLAQAAPEPRLRLAQKEARAAPASSAITAKSVERLAGSAC